MNDHYGSCKGCAYHEKSDDKSLESCRYCDNGGRESISSMRWSPELPINWEEKVASLEKEISILRFHLDQALADNIVLRGKLNRVIRNRS